MRSSGCSLGAGDSDSPGEDEDEDEDEDEVDSSGSSGPSGAAEPLAEELTESLGAGEVESSSEGVVLGVDESVAPGEEEDEDEEVEEGEEGGAESDGVSLGDCPGTSLGDTDSVGVALVALPGSVVARAAGADNSATGPMTAVTAATATARRSFMETSGIWSYRTAAQLAGPPVRSARMWPLCQVM
ncbi:hypothetical protein ACFWIA_03770 [Streptomyces sp. NPDC127068]|uniref:hypothetical protein n=1 Tax=Streptomyces sp. NPDC127068 TaxID=3347127 RepID=UPI003652A892